MMKRAPAILAAVGILLFTSSALASAPGGQAAELRIRSDINHLCSNDPARSCDPGQNPPPFDPASCVDAGDPIPSPTPTCDPDWIDGSESRGVLTIVADANATDNNSAGVIDYVVTIIFDITINGKRYAIAKSFDNATRDDAVFIGGWNASIQEFIFNIQSLVDTLPFALEPIGDRLAEIALAELGEPAVAVMVDAFGAGNRKNLTESDTADGCEDVTACGLLEVNEQDNVRASMAQYRVTLRFARPPAP